MSHGLHALSGRMPTNCPECGATLARGGTCLDLFHALLAMERDVPVESASGGRGEIAHFYAVSAYVLQHPDGMRYTAEALAGARRALADHLAGRVDLGTVRDRVRRATDGTARITRRQGEEPASWPVDSWPVTVATVLAGGAAEYVERVRAWAESVVRTLGASGVEP